MAGAFENSEADAVKQSVASNLAGILRPSLHNLEDHVLALRQSQQQLRQKLDQLLEELARPGEPAAQKNEQLENGVRRVQLLKRRLSTLANLLATIQERVQKLEPAVKRALERRLERVAVAERENAQLSGELDRLTQTSTQLVVPTTTSSTASPAESLSANTEDSSK